jgi:type IV pilus assembly protein PilM
MIGIDIGSDSVKAAVIDHAAQMPRLMQLVTTPVRKGAIREGEIMDSTAVIDALRKVTGQLGLMRNITVAVGGRDVIIRKISLDPVPEEDLHEVIRWEAESVVPFEMRDVSLGYQLLDPAGRGTTDVLLAVARKNLVEQRLQLLEKAGITAGIVDTDAFALFNAFELNYPMIETGLYALVNIGLETATIVVCHNGIPLGARDVPYGSRQLGCEGVDVPPLLATESSAPEVSVEAVERVSSLSRQRIAELGTAVERMVGSSVSAADRGCRPGAVFLAGGTAAAPGIGECLAHQMGVRVEVASPFLKLEVAPAALGTLTESHRPSVWMLAIGLALRPATDCHRKRARGRRWVI